MKALDIDYRLAELIATGQACVECQSEFVKPHGHVVACGYCFRRLSAEELVGVKSAVNEEVDVAYHKQRARQRRSRP